MKHKKNDLQRAIEHFVCYVFNDIAARTNSIEKYLDKKSEVIPGNSQIETSFRNLLVEDYSALMQRYAVCLFPIFTYIDNELPELKGQLEALKTLYQRVLDNGNFKNGCQCIGCKKFMWKEAQKMPDLPPEKVKEVLKEIDESIKEDTIKESKRLTRNETQKRYRAKKKAKTCTNTKKK